LGFAGGWTHDGHLQVR
jgi:hypothetical protein